MRKVIKKPAVMLNAVKHLEHLCERHTYCFKMLRAAQHDKLVHLLLVVTTFIFLTSFNAGKTLKGNWEFRGSILNGKVDGAPKDYILQRRYSDNQYNAYVIEKGQKTVKFESGNYKLLGDTCLETQTYCMQPSKLIGVTVHYRYSVRNDTLFLRAKLPNGAIEEDHWKKVK